MHPMLRPTPSDQVSGEGTPAGGNGGTMMLGSQEIVHNWSLIGCTVFSDTSKNCIKINSNRRKNP